jgi:threonine dehydrogenase-like Zn-dependent dehydrogenase
MLLTAPGRIERAEHPYPTPGPGQLLLRTTACGLCASEVDVFLGKNPWQQYPALLGHEVVGRIVARGPAVDRFREGDLIATARAAGGYADLTPVEVAMALPVPPGVIPHMALAEPLGCAVNAVQEIAPAPDDRIVLLGAGFLGLLLVQLLGPRAPAWLLATTRRPEAGQLARTLGATDVCAPDEVQSRVHELTGGEGADVVIEATGSEAMLALAASLLRPEGTLAIVGYHLGEGRRVPVHEWNWKALRLANCHVRSPARLMDGARRGLDLAARGAIKLRPLVTHSFALPDLQRAFETAVARPPGFVKAVVRAA